MQRKRIFNEYGAGDRIVKVDLRCWRRPKLG